MSVARAAAMVSGLPLNVPTCSYSPSTISDMTSSVPPIGAAGQPAADRLRQADDVGRDAEQLAWRRPAPIVEPGLHLVEREERAVPAGDVPERPPGSRGRAG